MPVPPDDIVCRFIRPTYWNKRDNRPKSAAFKQSGLSVWHNELLLNNGVSLETLQVGHLAGSGQAHHTAGQYIELADEVAQSEGTAFRVQVEWRPENATEFWQQWAYAHAQVEAIEGPDDFLKQFRDQLALRCHYQSPPTPP